ncbi:MAG TPA: glycosyltransferase family 4 protein [Candidatus Lumbricidophila sp.]|nr:glycosyltransferase family 4 protein [Candidatus Lumbricidophila sp.]
MTKLAIAYDCLYPVQRGGGERVYRRVAELLTERGIDVTYVTRAEWATNGAPRTPFDLVSVWRGPIYDARGNRLTGSALKFAFGLFRHFVRRRGRYDAVIVAALPVLNVFAVRLALLGSRTRIAVDWLEVWQWRKWREYAGLVTGTIAWVLQGLAAQIGRVQTVNSQFTKRNLAAYRRGSDPIVLGLVDLVGEPQSPHTRASDAPPFALFVGRHIPDKRLAALPTALEVAREQLPDLRLKVAGSGPETDRAKAAAVASGVADSCDWLGRVSDEVLNELYRTAAVLVNPSAREGFGLVVAEAAAWGTPSVVVAGADNAAAELVTNDVNGWVAADATAGELGTAIVAVVASGNALRARTLSWFASERSERSLAGSVDELLRRLRD